MEPVLFDADEVLVSDMNFMLDIERFDIVIIDKGEGKIIKRVIGLPNETIQFVDNQLYINGKRVEESFYSGYYESQLQTDDFGPITLEDDEYFVCGDNRQYSKDSRYIGSIQQHQILMKVIYLESK